MQKEQVMVFSFVKSAVAVNGAVRFCFPDPFAVLALVASNRPHCSLASSSDLKTSKTVSKLLSSF